MTSQDQFESVVGMLHEAALGDVKWSVPASRINETVRTNGNNLAIWQGHLPADLVFYFAQACYGSRRRRDYEERYLTHFFRRDEAVPRILWLPDGHLTPTGQLYSEREKKTSPVYNGSCKIRNGLYVRLDGLGGSSIVWGIAESTERGGGWSSTQTRMIEHLLPHIRQFARVRLMLGDAQTLGNSLGELLDHDRFGVIQLDRRARIAAANDRARRLLRQDGGLSDRGGFLNASMPAETATLQRLLARAAPPHGVQASAGSMTIGRPNARTRLVVHVTPVAEREWDVRAQRVAALVLIADPASRPRIDAGLVAEALNLTPAESRLATMVATGRTVRDIAAITGRTEGTVRWHLKKIFCKQGISRQADLVRRVLSLEGFPALRSPRSSRRQADGVTGDIRGSVPESRGEGR